MFGKCSHGFLMFTNKVKLKWNQILFRPSGVASRTNVLIVAGEFREVLKVCSIIFYKC